MTRATRSRRLHIEPLEDRAVPATLYVDDTLVAGTAIASLGSSVQVTNDRDSSGTLSAGDQVSIAVGETGTTAALTFGATAQSGDTGSAYATISAAIAASASGDTIAIATGTYAAVTVDKTLTLDGLTGSSADVVIAPATGDGITITANGVTVRDLSVSPMLGSGIVATGVSSLTLINVDVDTAAASVAAGLDLTGSAGTVSVLTLDRVDVAIGAAGTGAPVDIGGFATVNLTDVTLADVATAAAASIDQSGVATGMVNVTVTGSMPATFTASGASVQIDSDAVVTLTGVDQLNLTGGTGGDTFAITPDATGATTIRVNGTGGVDSLDLELTGLAGTSVSDFLAASGSFSGTVGFTAAADVEFAGIETLVDIAVVSGIVFNDADGDGTQDAGETGLAGVTVQLDTDANGSVDATALTGAGGEYAFALTAAGNQRVRIVVPANATQTTTNPADVAAVVGSAVSGGAFGVDFAAGTAGKSTVNGQTFADLNGNGTLDPGETGVNGLTVHLDLDADGKLDANEPSTVSATVGGTVGSYSLVSAVVGTTAQVRAVEKPGFLENTSSTTVQLTDGATQFVNVAVEADLPPQATPARRFSVGLVQGSSNTVRVFNDDGTDAFTISVAGSFPGGLRAATGDVTGDGVEDVIVTNGPGSANVVVVFDGNTKQEIFRTNVFESTFTGGAFVATGDLNLDGVRDVIVTPDEGGGPRVVVLRGGDFNPIRSFFAIEDANFRGGARAGTADVNADGRVDLIVSAGFGGGPRIAIYDGAAFAAGSNVKLVNDFFAFESTLRNGVYVTGGDINGDGFDDVIFGAGPGGGPRVLAISGQALMTAGSSAAIQAPLLNFFAGNPANRGGVRVSAKDMGGDGRIDVITGDGNGGTITGYRGDGAQEFQFSLSDSLSAVSGVYVG